MKKVSLLIFALLLTACGGRKINTGSAQNSIIAIPQEILEKEDVDIVSVQQVSGSNAIAETRLKTAFRLEKVEGKWVVREVRIGHGQWEKISNLLSALEEVRVRETRTMLDRVADAVQQYWAANGRWPAFKDYISLSDILTPKYLTPLIRLDGWRRPLEAKYINPNSILIMSAGPDGKFGTADDIQKTIAAKDK
jgi:hypothetical protein